MKAENFTFHYSRDSRFKLLDNGFSSRKLITNGKYNCIFTTALKVNFCAIVVIQSITAHKIIY